ncbi:DUF1990 family protein [Saccharopolyspora sp. CA-218241]|uniref:DUF1990 family protein n=1 Tax=Saccharopolyspora sp. CA-218241 TaxID=3240027 RepID=UPI003D954261
MPITERTPVIALRWAAGMALISWRYLWQTTPLYRTEEFGDDSDLPPALPADLVDEHSQLAPHGVGPLFHRRFGVHVEGGSLTAQELIDVFSRRFDRAVPREVAAVSRRTGTRGALQPGDELVVRMPGPWDAPVRVVERTPESFRLATLRSHLEAGLIEFRASPEDDGLRFEIEAWARPSTAVVHLLYSRLRLAKEMQLNMWVRSCLAAAALAGGRARDGVTIHTRRCVWPQ